MTAATYTSDLSDIFLFESTTNVSAYGGGGAGLGTGADFAMEGTLCVDKQITAAEKGFLYVNGSNFTIGSNDHFYVWINVATPGLCDTRNNRGIVACIGDDAANFVKFHVNGKDTLPLGGGRVYAIRFVNTSLANRRTLVGTPSTTPKAIGGGANTTAAVKGANLGVDGARIGTGYDVLHGTGADPEANFAGIAADDVSTSEGIFQPIDGGYALRGKIRIGSASTACEFLSSNTSIVVPDTLHSLSNFSEIIIENASTIVTLTRVTFRALGTNNRGQFRVLTSTATVSLAACSFVGWGTTVLGTGSTFTRCAWVGSGVITANGAVLTSSSITGFEGTADTSPLVWDVNTDPDGKLDGMLFEKGTAATHAITFGSTAPLTMTLRNWTTTGYNASNGQNDSTFLLADRGSDQTWTINIIGGSGNFSYKKARAGDTVNIVIQPVVAQFTVVDAVTGAAIQGARVTVVGASTFTGGGSVTITRSGSTATVSHTAHGFSDGDVVRIYGADQNEYNGSFPITNVSSNAYDYTVSGTPTTPATGSIVSAIVVVNALTDADGKVSDTRAWPADQVFSGRVRKGSAPPVYKTQPVAGTISATSGADVTAPMVSD